MAKQDLSDPDAVFGNADPRAPLVVEGGIHCWTLAGPSVRVEMRSAAIFRISHDLMREIAADESPAGLLLGKVDRLDTGMVRLKITSVEPCDFKELDSALLNSNLVLGFYRIARQGELAFTDLDLNLARWRFPDQHRVFLLVRASRSGAEVRFFYWNDKEIASEESEFPAAIRWSPPSIPVLPRPAATAVAPPSPEPSDEDVSWKQLAKARIVGLILSVAARVRRFREDSSTEARAPDTRLELHNPEAASGRRRLVKPAILTLSLAVAVALIVTAVIRRSSATPKRLDLTTQLVGNSLRLSWTRGAPVASATEGILSIKDGEQQQQLPLNSKQLHEENVVYIPKSDKVTFTLQIFTDGAVHRDSIMVSTPRPPGAVASASPPTHVPAQPQRPVLSPAAQPSARPETVVQALPQPRIKNPKSGQRVAAKPPEPRLPAPPPAVRRAPARASIPTRTKRATSPAKERAAPEAPIDLPSPPRRK